MNTKSRDAMKRNMLKQAEATAASVTSIEDRFNRADRLGAPASASQAPSDTRTPLIDPDAIKDREKDLRTLNQKHVLELALSIAAVGIIHPVVLDENDTLLAGGHRVAALRFMKKAAKAPIDEVAKVFADAGFVLEAATVENFATAFARHFPAGVPVVVRPLNGADPERLRLEIEISENEKRSDFTREDLKNIVERLESAGYKRTAGRPKAGELVLSQELERIIGKSRATVFRVLEEIKDGPTAKHEKSQAAKAAEKKASEVLETKVQIREADEQAGSIVIHYSSTRQRSALLKQLGLKD